MAPETTQQGVVAAAISAVSFLCGWYSRRLAARLSSQPPQVLPTADLTAYAVVEESAHGQRVLYAGADAASAKRKYQQAPPSRFAGAVIVLRHGGLERARRMAGSL